MEPHRMSAHAPFDAAVVGSGPNGLCAAIVLARAGLSVVVYESRATIGGGARTAELTLPGFRHDICSSIYPMAIGSPFMRTLSLSEHGLEWIHPPVPLAHPLDLKPTILLERKIDATASHLGEDAPRYTRMMTPFVTRWEELAADAMAPLRVPAHPWLMWRFGLQAFRSATSLAQSAFRGARARALLAGLAAHAVLPLDVMPSSAIGLMLGYAAHAVGWPMPRGGAQQLSESLASLLRALGGVIRTDTRITMIDEVETDGPILFDISPYHLATIAASSLPENYCRRLRTYRYGPGVFKVDWALDTPVPWRDAACAQAGTVHLGGTCETIAASERAVWEGRYVDQPYVLFAQHSLFDATRAPAGKHTAWAYCHVPNGSTRDLTAIVEDQVERYAPGFRDCILARHAMHAMDYEAYNDNYIGGDINGGAPILSQLFTRPLVRLNPYTTPNRRLYLCSAATPPGGGVHGMCGVYAANAALKRWGGR
jgi:phytoene dehydrogenase-like protein